jgi:hypothetical protein
MIRACSIVGLGLSPAQLNGSDVLD